MMECRFDSRNCDHEPNGSSASSRQRHNSYLMEGWAARAQILQRANKLFELSRSGPVGIMIYGSAGLQGVPWELPIKAFREALGEQFDVLQTYPERFFEFVEHNDKLFSAESKSDALLSMVGAAAFRLNC